MAAFPYIPNPVESLTSNTAIQTMTPLQQSYDMKLSPALPLEISRVLIAQGNFLHHITAVKMGCSRPPPIAPKTTADIAEAIECFSIQFEKYQEYLMDQVIKREIELSPCGVSMTQIVLAAHPLAIVNLSPRGPAIGLGDKTVFRRDPQWWRLRREIEWLQADDMTLTIDWGNEEVSEWIEKGWELGRVEEYRGV